MKTIIFNIISILFFGATCISQTLYTYDETGNRVKKTQVAAGGCSTGAVYFSGKVLLQGAFNTGTSQMNNTLNSLGILTTFARSQPYKNTNFSYTGSEAVADTFFAKNTAIVDWVLLELHDPNVPTAAVTAKACFVKQDGTLVDTSGNNTILEFKGVPTGNYFVVVRHRNHLAIRSTAVLPFFSGPQYYDFTTSGEKAYQVQNYASMVQIGSVWAMIGGNATSKTSVKYNGPGNAQNQILNIKLGGSLSAVLNNVYAPEDVNMNGNVKWNGPGNDQNFLLNTVLKGSLSAVINEQMQ